LIEAIGSIVVGLILAVVQILLIKRIDDMAKKIDLASDWVSVAKEKHSNIQVRFDGVEHVLNDHEERLHEVEKFSDRVKIYHRQNHNQEL
jgi:hypothetical protein